MATTFNPSVLQCISELTDILVGINPDPDVDKYEVSTKRPFEKIDRMFNSLLEIETSICHRICMHKNLGQEFDKSGNPIHLNLKRYNYKDESGYQWAFAYLLKNNGDVEITKMMGANQIIETHIRDIVNDIISENNEKYGTWPIYNRSYKLYIKESQLRRLVRECIHDALQNRRTRV